MGHIGDSELNVCRVLNSARNEAAHSLDGISEKWRAELIMVASGKTASRIDSDRPLSLGEALPEIIALIAAPYLHLKFQSRLKAFREDNKRRWLELMKEKLRAHPELIHAPADDPRAISTARDVDLIIARELATSTRLP